MDVFKRLCNSLVLKVKQSHYRPSQALRVPGSWSSQISRQSAHEDGKVVSPTQRPPLPPSKYSWYSFLLEAESTQEGLCQWKIPMTPLGIEPATFRFAAQCLNQFPHRGPQSFGIKWHKYLNETQRVFVTSIFLDFRVTSLATSSQLLTQTHVHTNLPNQLTKPLHEAEFLLRS